jgi:hypothetical protein
MVGHPDYSWDLEFTHQHGVTVARAPSKEHLLVFYEQKKEEWDMLVQRMEGAGEVRVESENPYWDKSEPTFEDPEGWRVMLQNAGWP